MIDKKELERLAAHLENFRSFPDDLAAAAGVRELLAENAAMKPELHQVCRFLDCTPDNLLDVASKMHRVVADCERLEAREAELRAEVERLMGMVPAWRKIDEDTPLDVDLLLAYFYEWPNPQWAVESGWAGSTKGGWRHGQATHWMPLPEAPHD